MIDIIQVLKQTPDFDTEVELRIDEAIEAKNDRVRWALSFIPFSNHQCAAFFLFSTKVGDDEIINMLGKDS